MKKREYLFVTVKRADGSEYPNPLKLDEIHLIKSLLRLKHNVSLKVELAVCNASHYKYLFG